MNRVDGSESMDLRGAVMIMTDPPKHTRYRRLVNKGFTPRMIGIIEQHLRRRAVTIVDNVIERGECDFVVDIAAELPRSEEHTSELQSRTNLVCRLLLEKKKYKV